MHTRTLGHFEVTSGKVIVTDPCYSRDVHDEGEAIVKAMNGRWIAYIQHDGRVNLLTVEHKNAVPDRIERMKWKVGVDSGQAGVFDEAKYPQLSDEGAFEYTCREVNKRYIADSNNFYSRACLETLNDMAGIIDEGVVSSSGWGDGAYDCYVSFKGDEAVRITIEFISEEYDEGEEGDYEDDEEDDCVDA